MTAADFAIVAAFHLMAAISPGPSFVLSVRTAAAEGLRPAAGLALGFGIGAGLWAAAALLGLSVLFEVAPVLLTAMKVAGAAFLAWLAVAMWRHAAEPLPPVDADAPPRRAAAAIRLGVMAMLANPKPAIFFGAVFVGLMPAEATTADRLIVLANIVWVETAWYVVVARVFSFAPARAAYLRAKAWVDRALGAALGALAVSLVIP